MVNSIRETYCSPELNAAAKSPVCSSAIQGVGLNLGQGWLARVALSSSLGEKSYRERVNRGWQARENIEALPRSIVRQETRLAELIV